MRKPYTLDRLAFSDAVVLPATPRFKETVAEDDTLFIHLGITGKCYARCKGCINASFTKENGKSREALVPFSDTIPDRDARCILRLLERDGGTTATVCFYGGEPLLAVDKMGEVWNVLQRECGSKKIRAMIYTNGELLPQAIERQPALIRDTWLFAVSIDGGDKQHDRVRLGTSLARIRSGLTSLAKVRTGQVLVWSTLREEQSLWDCFEEFLSLFNSGLADQFFWHWIEADSPFIDFSGYLSRYGEELSRILDIYLNWLADGRIMPVTHLNELIIYLLTGRDRGSSACGVELERNFDLVGGLVHACADLPQELAIGEVDPGGVPRLKGNNLRQLVQYKEDLGCPACGIHPYCGGRCPVEALAGNRERLNQYCLLMRLHVGIVMERIEELTSLLERRGIRLQQIYDTSARFNRYTDVTP